MKHFTRQVASPFQATIAGFALAAGLLAAPAAHATDVSLTSYLKCRSTQLTQFPGTIVDAAVATPELSTLVSLVQAADLVAPLAGKGPLTVFAPTNAAFAKVPAPLLNVIGSDVNLLTAVLTYHVVSGRVLKDQVPVNTPIATLQGATFSVGADLRITDGRGRQAAIVATDILCSNGVVHLIDRVILPPA